MKPPRFSWAIALAAATAATAAVLSVLCLLALNNGGEVGIGKARLVDLATGHTRALDRRLAAQRPDLAKARAETRHILRLYPYDASAWARLAYLDVQPDGRVGPEGVKGLGTSYDLMAYDPYIAYWRIGFALEHWRGLPRDIKKAVLAEARVFGAAPGKRDKVLAVLSGVKSPYGQLPAAILTAEINEGGSPSR